MGLWTDIIGSTRGYIILAFGGVRLKNSSGNLSLRNAADSADAQVVPQSLGTGTRNGTKFLRDDGIWSTPPIVPQSILSGPVDSSGFSAFGGSTGGTSVTASGTLVATCFAGSGAHYTGAITNPSWTGLSTNGIMYLFLDITASEVVTTASSTVSQVCQSGGTPATTSGLLTVNWQEGKCYLGNGSSAPQAYRVAVGEVTVTGGVVTSIVWYALLRRYDSGLFAVSAGNAYTKSHNLGNLAYNYDISIADDSAGTNERPVSIYSNTGSVFIGYVPNETTRTSVKVSTLSGGVALSASGGILSSGYYRIRVRGPF